MSATPEAWATAASALALGLVGAYAKLQAVGKDSKKARLDGELVREQIENGHTTNLREDLTEVKRAAQLNSDYLRDVVSEQLHSLSSGFSDVLGEMRGLRTDVGDERSARREAIKTMEGTVAKLENKIDDIRSHQSTTIEGKIDDIRRTQTDDRGP